MRGFRSGCRKLTRPRPGTGRVGDRKQVRDRPRAATRQRKPARKGVLPPVVGRSVGPRRPSCGRVPRPRSGGGLGSRPHVGAGARGRHHAGSPASPSGTGNGSGSEAVHGRLTGTCHGAPGGRCRRWAGGTRSLPQTRGPRRSRATPEETPSGKGARRQPGPFAASFRQRLLALALPKQPHAHPVPRATGEREVASYSPCSRSEPCVHEAPCCCAPQQQGASSSLGPGRNQGLDRTECPSLRPNLSPGEQQQLTNPLDRVLMLGRQALDAGTLLVLFPQHLPQRFLRLS